MQTRVFRVTSAGEEGTALSPEEAKAAPPVVLRDGLHGASSRVLLDDALS